MKNEIVEDAPALCALFSFDRTLSMHINEINNEKAKTALKDVSKVFKFMRLQVNSTYGISPFNKGTEYYFIKIEEAVKNSLLELDDKRFGNLFIQLRNDNGNDKAVITICDAYDTLQSTIKRA